MSPEFSRSSDNGPRVTLALMFVRKYQRLSRVSSSSWNVIAGVLKAVAVLRILSANLHHCDSSNAHDFTLTDVIRLTAFIVWQKFHSSC